MLTSGRRFRNQTPKSSLTSCFPSQQLRLRLQIMSLMRNLQSWPKYFRQTLIFVWNSTLQEKFNFFFFQDFFASIDKILILWVRLSARLWFYVLRFSWYLLISLGPKSYSQVLNRRDYPLIDYCIFCHPPQPYSALTVY